MSYRVEYQEQAAIDLEKLPKAQQKRILTKISWLADNFDSIRPL